jgi:uncharacterized protein (TIGR02118 family)
MIKRISLIRRQSHLTHEAFFAHWTGPHADIVRQMPGLRGLRYCLVQSWSPEAAAWDGVGEIWFDSIADAEAAFASEPVLSLLTEDRKLFIAETQSCFVIEHTDVPPPDGR